jgi:hypothetical protein
MFRLISLLYLLITGLALISSCRRSSTPDPAPVIPPENFHADDLPVIDGSVPNNITISWSNTARKLSHDVYYAEYGRLKKLGGDTMFLLYHYGSAGNEWDNIALRKSFDGGTNWTPVETLMADDNPNYWGFANPEMIVLQNGWLMFAYTGRGRPDDNLHDNIQIRLSKDRGKTWAAPIIAATGRSWEPAMIQLPDGEIQLFYSSEAAWWPGNNPQQEILMVKSDNNGNSWSQPKRVAYTPGMRDGMATPLILKDNKGIVFPIESVNNSKSPWIVWTSMSARWNYKAHGTAENGRRWLATAQNIWGGAPYIIQLPSGETILSVQDAGGRTIGSDWKKNTMLVLVGNASATNFTNITYPWPGLPVNEGAYYSSLILKNDSTLVMLTTRNFADNHSEIYWKEGKIVR